MTCHSFDQLMDGRSPGVGGAARSSADVEQLLRDHAAVCGRCAGRLDDERALLLSLGALAAADRTLEAPSEIETRLLDAFDAEHRRRERLAASRPVLQYGALAASALLAAVASVAWFMHEPARESPPPTVTQSTAASVAVLRDDPPASTANPSPLHPRMQRAALTARARPAGRATADGLDREVLIATSFIPVVGAPELYAGETLQLMRVRLPRSSLPAFGIGVDENRTAAMIDADLLLGDDGVARASSAS